VDFFKGVLRKPCLLMFDGVDEVEPADRPAVRSAVESLLADYDHARLYCMIASRPSASYISDQMAGFTRCEVQRLSSEQRSDLIHFWHTAVYLDDPARGKEKADGLARRIETAPGRVRELATTPLMVTIFCMVSYSHDLPRLRAKLYEDAIQVLLTEVTYHDEEEQKGLQEWGGMDWETRRDHLAFIAFTMQEKAVIAMLETDLVDLIWKRFGDEQEPAEKSARDFLRTIAARGGLLEAQDEEYGFFTHATFQEYLAGRYLAEEKQPQWKTFLAEYCGNDQWLESIRLAAGYLSIAGKDRADRFVNLLAGLGKSPEQCLRALALGGEALSDMEEKRREAGTVKSISAQMLAGLTANPPQAPARLRSRLGLALGEIGDPRFLPSPALLNAEIKVILPDLLPIPSGQFQMGTSEKDEALLKKQKTQVYDGEKPAHTVYVSEFSIARFPVTNAEFALFVEKGGYSPQAEWWSAEGRRWRTGEWDSNLSVYDKSIQEDIRRWLERRPPEQRRQPFFWDDPQWKAPNLPVVGVSWFEAEAYANWLKILTGQPYRLPTEAEWEKAARGEEGYLWPWGNTWDAGRCNNTEPEDKIGRTSPIGMYPHGESPYHVLEMVGNVWEWCADWWQADIYQSRAGQEVKDPCGPETGSVRVLRGGSWNFARNDARCAYRSRGGPDVFNYDLGFRLVLSPSSISAL
jgi:formylglycine-generating enzyme required for sulfatase activity